MKVARACSSCCPYPCSALLTAAFQRALTAPARQLSLKCKAPPNPAHGTQQRHCPRASHQSKGAQHDSKSHALQSVSQNQFLRTARECRLSSFRKTDGVLFPVGDEHCFPAPSAPSPETTPLLQWRRRRCVLLFVVGVSHAVCRAGSEGGGGLRPPLRTHRRWGCSKSLGRRR